jgi:hypothetical protein
MGRRASAIPGYLIDLRSVLLGFAIFNFTITWMMDLERRTCTIGPYPTRGSYLIEPTILLMSSLFLTLNRRWGSTVALLVSGYLFSCFLRILLINNDPVTVLRDWTHSDVLHLSRQFLFALIVFCYSALSLTKNFLSRNVTTPAG